MPAGFGSITNVLCPNQNITPIDMIETIPAGKSEEQLLEYVERHYGERMPFYEKAQYTVKGENLDAKEILSLMTLSYNA